MQKLEQVYEGKAKKVFKTDDPELYIVDYKDDATAFNGLKKGTIVGKGVINNQINKVLLRTRFAKVRRTNTSPLFHSFKICLGQFLICIINSLCSYIIYFRHTNHRHHCTIHFTKTRTFILFFILQ